MLRPPPGPTSIEFRDSEADRHHSGREPALGTERVRGELLKLVERLEGQGLDHDEVGGPDRVGMAGQEGAPALAGRLRMASPARAAD